MPADPTPTDPLITSDPRIMGGAPCIAGTRIPADVVAGRFLTGESVLMLAEDYDLPLLTIEVAIRRGVASRDCCRRAADAFSRPSTVTLECGCVAAVNVRCGQHSLDAIRSLPAAKGGE